ncbi:MAG: aldo/keto reductase [Pseudomonadota bacterium]
MQQRPLGQTGIAISALSLGLGAALMSVAKRSRADAQRLIDAALDAGINYFDTADIYGRGESERLIASLLGHRADEVTVATKAGHTHGGSLRLKELVGRVFGRRKAGHDATGEDYMPRYIERAARGCLQRLNREALQVFQLHSPPPPAAQHEAVAAHLDHLQSQGLLERWGVSCFRSHEAPELACLAGCALVQFPANLRVLDGRSELAGRLEALTVGRVGRQPYAHGRLFDAQAFPALAALFPERAALADALLRYSLFHTPTDTVLVGTGSLEHLLANVAAVERGPLAADVQAALRAAMTDQSGRCDDD